MASNRRGGASGSGNSRKGKCVMPPELEFSQADFQYENIDLSEDEYEQLHPEGEDVLKVQTQESTQSCGRKGGPKTKTSDMFTKHFTKVPQPNGKERAQCNYCQSNYAWNKGNGYGSLTKHLMSNHPLNMELHLLNRNSISTTPLLEELQEREEAELRQHDPPMDEEDEDDGDTTGTEGRRRGLDDTNGQPTTNEQPSTSRFGTGTGGWNRTVETGYPRFGSGSPYWGTENRRFGNREPPVPEPWPRLCESNK
ncbi:hypothetical protein OROMI_034982 [Orobanche minor]